MTQHVLQVGIWNQTQEQIEEASKKRDQTFDYTKDFDLQTALDTFPRYVDKEKSLLDAKLVSSLLLNVQYNYSIQNYIFHLAPICPITKQILMPYFKNYHYTLYVMNKYKKEFEILDSRNYADTKGCTPLYTRSTYHTECDIIVSIE
jgi:hypothetical protein